MEREHPQSEPTIDLELLRQVKDGQMLQFTDDGFRLYDRNYPGEPLAVASLAELFDSRARASYDTAPIADEIATDEFRAWADSLVTPEAVTYAAAAEMERRAVEGDSEVTPCADCNGEPGAADYFSKIGSIPLGVAIDPEELAASPAAEAPDPNCETCDGRGEVAKYPSVVLRHEVTGEERVLTLDLAALVASGKADVRVGSSEKLYADGYQIGEKSIDFDLSRYIDEALASLGLDRNDTAIVWGDGYMGKIEEGHIGTAAGWSHWRKLGDKIREERNALSAAELLAEAQARISKAYQPHRNIKNEGGVVVAGEWVLRPLPPMTETLKKLQAAAAKRGYTLGATASLIDTDRRGVGLFLLDTTEGVSHLLGASADVREALVNAWGVLSADYTV
jgi:hypothetical protein